MMFHVAVKIVKARVLMESWMRPPGSPWGQCVRTLARQGQRLAMTALSPSAVDCRLAVETPGTGMTLECWLVVTGTLSIFPYIGNSPPN